MITVYYVKEIGSGRKVTDSFGSVEEAEDWLTNCTQEEDRDLYEIMKEQQEDFV